LCLPKPAETNVRKHSAPLLYYITDRRQFRGSGPEQEQRLLEKVAECAAAGVDFVQMREKDLSTRELERLAAKTVAAMPRGTATRLLINSRIDVALACGAHGVHLSANSLSASEARAIFARAGAGNAVIGVSTHSAAQVASAESHGADFAVFGPVFEKGGIENPTGLDQLAAIANRLEASTPSMPVLALGGVTLENAPACIRAGAGIAAIRLFQDADVSRVVTHLRSLHAAGTTAPS
jgi:thiamine-phosphate pyrophosphorylase